MNADRPAGVWDVVVIGAGPAGSAAAIELGRRGRSVLLAEKAVFPRNKVCGGCVSHSAVADLEALGVHRALDDAGAIPLKWFRWSAGGRQAELPLPGGLSVTRATMDDLLVERAAAEGVQVRMGTAARMGPTRDGHRVVEFRTGADRQTVRASMVVVAAGLAGQTMGERGGRPAEGSSANLPSRVGVGCVFPGDSAASAAFEPGTIHMASGREGYVGASRAECGRLVVGAALDPAVLREQTPAAACRALLAGNGWSLPETDDEERWQGTPRMTRSRERPVAARVVYVGDSAGYVEPFTGEGMAWALRAGRLAAPSVDRGVDRWSASVADEWVRRYRFHLQRRQRACRAVARLLRSPRVVSSALFVLGRYPALARPLTSHLHAAHP